MLLCFAQLFGFWEVVTLSVADMTPLSMKGKPTWRNGLHNRNRAPRKILYSVMNTDKHMHKETLCSAGCKYIPFRCLHDH
jgi:hypothetical protein